MKLSMSSGRITLALASLAAVGLLACGDESIPELKVGTGSACGAAVLLQTYAGLGQKGVVRTSLTDSLAIQLITSTGQPVGGSVVKWSSSATQATMSPTSNTTNSLGIARSRWTLGQTAGVQTASASVDCAPNPVSFTAIATPGAPTFARAQANVDAQTGVILQRLPVDIKMLIVDNFDNPVPTTPADGATPAVYITVQFMYATAGDSGTIIPLTVDSTTTTGQCGTSCSTTTNLGSTTIKWGTADGNGLITAIWTLGTRVGAQAVRVQATGAGSFTRLTATGTASAPAPAAPAPTNHESPPALR